MGGALQNQNRNFVLLIALGWDCERQEEDVMPVLFCPLSVKVHVSKHESDRRSAFLVVFFPYRERHYRV